MVVFMVDAHCIFYRLYRYREIASVYTNSRDELIIDLVVGFFNVLAHYRRFFARNLRKDNDIFCVFNREPTAYHETYQPGFKEKLYKQYDPNDRTYGFVNRCMVDAWKFIVSMSPYFEGIYCLDNQGIDDHALIASSKLYNQNNLYVLFSKTSYTLQLLSDNVVQLYNKREKSRLITKDTCYSEGVLFGLKTVANNRLTPDLLPLIWTLAGCPDVSMKKTRQVPNIRYGVKIANTMFAAGDLGSGISIQSFIDLVREYVRKNGEELIADREYFLNRHRVLDLQLCAKALTSDQLNNVMAQCYDVYDQNELERVNERLAEITRDGNIISIEKLNMSSAVKASWDYDDM